MSKFVCEISSGEFYITDKQYLGSLFEVDDEEMKAIIDMDHRTIREITKKPNVSHTCNNNVNIKLAM